MCSPTSSRWSSTSTLIIICLFSPRGRPVLMHHLSFRISMPHPQDSVLVWFFPLQVSKCTCEPTTMLWVSEGIDYLPSRLLTHISEMSLNAEPISGSIVDDFPDVSLKLDPQSSHGRESIFIDGIDIVANRLFGPQPNTSTYLCIWEIHVGRVKSCLSTPQVNALLAALKSFDSGFDDVLDAPAKEVSLPLDPDGEALFAQV
jgi:hypothetical protein